MNTVLVGDRAANANPGLSPGHMRVRMSHVCNREHLQTQTCFHPVSPSHTIPKQLHVYKC
jgi:hypothetical protein